MQNLQKTKVSFTGKDDENFPLNFILYPAFYSSAYSDDLLNMISDHIVNNFSQERKIDDQFYCKTKLNYPPSSQSFHHVSDEDDCVKKDETHHNIDQKLLNLCGRPEQIYFSSSGKMIKIFNENNFDMQSIITPNEETTQLFGKSVRSNTTTSLIQHNLSKKKENENEGLNEAKRKFIYLQKLRKQQQLILEEHNPNQLGLENIPDTHGYYHQRKLENFKQSQSPSISPVISDASGSIMFDNSVTGRNELRECIRHNGIGSFDLMAVVCTLQTYFKQSGRFLRQVNKHSYGFTIKINSENKEYALQFIEDLEMSQEKPIESCTITFKKTYYNFHVSCPNQKQVENVIDLYMKKHVQSKLSLKIFTH